MTIEGWGPLALAAHCVRNCGEENDLLRIAGAMIRWQFDENAKLRELVRRIVEAAHYTGSWIGVQNISLLREAEVALEWKL